MNRAIAPVVIVGLVLLVLISGMFYQVDETEQVIITQFGRPVSEPITSPGLHAKVPFIQTVRRFDKRVLEWDGSAEQIPTLGRRKPPGISRSRSRAGRRSRPVSRCHTTSTVPAMA